MERTEMMNHGKEMPTKIFDELNLCLNTMPAEINESDDEPREIFDVLSCWKEQRKILCSFHHNPRYINTSGLYSSVLERIICKW